MKEHLFALIELRRVAGINLTGTPDPRERAAVRLGEVLHEYVNVFDGDCGGGDQACGGVAEHVRVQVRDPGGLGDAGVRASDVGRVEGCADLGGEDEVVIVVPMCPGVELVGALHGALSLEGGNDRGRDL